MIKGTDDIKDILKFMNAPDDIKEYIYGITYLKDKSYYYCEYSIGTNDLFCITVYKYNGCSFKLHNMNGPARIVFYTYGNIKTIGNIKSIEYFKKNALCRFIKPAFITYDKNGNIIYETFYLSGHLHNSVGPAIRAKNKNKWENKFYNYGKKITLEQFCNNYEIKNIRKQ